MGEKKRTGGEMKNFFRIIAGVGILLLVSDYVLPLTKEQADLAAAVCFFLGMVAFMYFQKFEQGFWKLMFWAGALFQLIPLAGALVGAGWLPKSLP